jgi:hypothetical protein
VVGWRDVAGEHPLEALYEARDVLWQAVSETRCSQLSEADQACCEHVALELATALEALGTSCALTSPARRTGAEPDRQAWLSHVLDSLPREQTDHRQARATTSVPDQDRGRGGA